MPTWLRHVACVAKNAPRALYVVWLSDGEGVFPARDTLKRTYLCEVCKGCGRTKFSQSIG